jgi:REP element-mobilizing transposase RayT
MSDKSTGGRSSATPQGGSKNTTESGGSSLLRRKRLAHFPAVESGFRSVIIFLTVCTKGRRPLLANDAATRLIVEAWAAASFWLVGRYVILPDHIHLFCAPNTSPQQPLKNWISFWRNYVTRGWRNREDIPIWQTEYWDRQLRRLALRFAAASRYHRPLCLPSFS